MLRYEAFSIPISQRDRAVLCPNCLDPSNQILTRKSSVHLPLTILFQAADKPSIMNNSRTITPIQIKHAEPEINLIKLPRPGQNFPLATPFSYRQRNIPDAPAEFFGPVED